MYSSLLHCYDKIMRFHRIDKIVGSHENVAEEWHKGGLGVAHGEQWHCPQWAMALPTVDNGSAHGGHKNGPFFCTYVKNSEV